MKARFVHIVSAVTCIAALSGCVSRTPSDALTLRPQSLLHRQISTRHFDTADESFILAAAAGLLQDLGFTIDRSESHLGLIVASKDRSAREAGQVVGKFMMAALFRAEVSIDENQKLRASIVTRPCGGEIAIRVTFQRTVWNDRGQVSRREMLDDPKLYQEFFDRLSKAVLLEAHRI